MEQWFLKILCNPQTGAPFVYEDFDFLTDTEGVQFPVINGIPNFLSIQKNTITDDAFQYVDHYTKDAEVFDYFEPKVDRVTASAITLQQDMLLRRIPKATRLLLDVGCGSAFVARYFQYTDCHVVSLDVARANAEKAVSKYSTKNHAAVVADVFDLPFSENTFDCIVASEIIEHTVDPKKFMEALLKVLKPGGILILSTPYREKIEYSLCVHCNQPTPKNAHLHTFDKEILKKLILDLSVSIERMQLVGNKFLLRTHLIVPIRVLGFPILKSVDAIFNLLIPKAQHIILKIKKI